MYGLRCRLGVGVVVVVFVVVVDVGEDTSRSGGAQHHARLDGRCQGHRFRHGTSLSQGMMLFFANADIQLRSNSIVFFPCSRDSSMRQPTRR
jgi:hypothetical protein